MSILDRLRQNAHLDDAALAGVLADASLSGGSTGAAHPHLEHCASCRQRFAALERWLNGLRDDAIIEAEEAFPADRLAMQHAQIMRRLEAAQKPARVIAFPRFARPISAGGAGPHRWVAAAAAAGLVVGLAVGQVMNLERTLGRSAGRTPESLQTQAPQRGLVTPVSTVQSEETFLAVLDDLVSVRGVPELRPMDQLTPGARDYLTESR